MSYMFVHCPSAKTSIIKQLDSVYHHTFLTKCSCHMFVRPQKQNQLKSCEKQTVLLWAKFGPLFQFLQFLVANDFYIQLEYDSIYEMIYNFVLCLSTKPLLYRQQLNMDAVINSCIIISSQILTKSDFLYPSLSNEKLKIQQNSTNTLIQCGMSISDVIILSSELSTETKRVNS